MSADLNGTVDVKPENSDSPNAIEQEFVYSINIHVLFKSHDI